MGSNTSVPAPFASATIRAFQEGYWKALNEKCYALSVKLLSECGGSLDDNGEQSSTYLHVVDVYKRQGWRYVKTLR